MAKPDDISDIFDDELTQSILKGQDGPWRDEQPQFVDPALKAIEEQLAGNKRRNYRERRMEELKRRGEREAEAAQQARKRAPASAAAPAPVWGEGGFAETGEAPSGQTTPSPAPTVEAATRPPAAAPADDPGHGRSGRSPIAQFAIAIANATLVISAAAAAHILLTGWSPLLLLRALAVGIVTGALWQQLRTGRLRATAIAAGAYTAGFLPSDQLGRLEHMLALFLGLFAVVAGAALLGDRRVRF